MTDYDWDEIRRIYCPDTGFFCQLLAVLEVIIRICTTMDFCLILPDQVMVRYGVTIGSNGADVISVNRATGEVILWDNKFRSEARNLKRPSPTFAPNRISLRKAVEQAKLAINDAKLAEDISTKAVKNLSAGNYTSNTVGSGALKNSFSIRYCKNILC